MVATYKKPAFCQNENQNRTPSSCKTLFTVVIGLIAIFVSSVWYCVFGMQHAEASAAEANRKVDVQQAQSNVQWDVVHKDVSEIKSSIKEFREKQEQTSKEFREKQERIVDLLLKNKN
jgi:hypothetical protein